MLTRACAFGILFALSVPAPAHAGWRIDRSKAIADIVWQHPCAGNVSIAWADPAAAFTEVNPFAPPLAWSYREQCRVVLNAPWEQRWGFPWPKICTMLIHEYGHLAGYFDPVGVRGADGTVDHGHSSNPRSVMAPVQRTVDRRCRKRGRPYLEQHGVLTSRSRSGARPHGRHRRSRQSAALRSG